ncbi:hypothetical protein R3P38DRAFT_2785850 [Favolaschia claudopus]|uniref:Uncharacterized protein n=1 Tax=Favolaschia claudopus TaxID=2862362 RepID=A0AAW0AUA7_9AGAR
MEGGMQLDDEASALPHLVTTSSTQLRTPINAIYCKTTEFHLNLQRSPNLSSARSSASSIVETCFSSKTAASDGAQTEPALITLGRRASRWKESSSQSQQFRNESEGHHGNDLLRRVDGRLHGATQGEGIQTGSNRRRLECVIDHRKEWTGGRE